MPRLFRSAAYRIALLYALGFTAAVLVLGVVIVLVAHIALTRQLEGQIYEEALALKAEYHLEGFRELAFAIHERERGKSANEMLYAVYAPDGRRIAGSLGSPRPSLGWSDIVFQDPEEGADSARCWAVDLDDGARLAVAADTSVVDRVDQRLVVIVLVAFAAILVLSLIGAFILGAYLQRRLSAISGAADRIMAGDMAQRVPESGTGDEFDALALSLNRMLDRIADLMDNLRQVSSDIAHDLRTPLARLRSHLEDSLELERGDWAQHERIESALAQSDRILSLFGSILRISEVEGGRRRASFRTFDLSAMVRDIAESYVPPVEEGGRSLSAEIAPGLMVQGEVELLAQALINLLDNAQIHTPQGTSIGLALERSGESAVLLVSDTGPGVPAEARQAIFRRFVRLDPARGVPGHGLGLNLVAAIVTAHGGTIEARDNGPGLRIVVSLPLAAEES